MIVASFFAPRFEKYENCNYDELAMLLDKSCKKLGLDHYVISDNFRPKPLKTFVTKLPENLMQAILYGQMRFMEWCKEPILFTGCDCLITRAQGLNSDSIQDIAITTSKEFSDCEMNTGAVWIRSGEVVIPTWKAALETEPKEWGDDQTSLYEAILESNLNVLKLRCEDHNWAPKNINDNANMPTVVHFRGKRKKFMKEWGEKYLNLE
jgi:hypothetical protein